jgi:hypothetical protein
MSGISSMSFQKEKKGNGFHDAQDNHVPYNEIEASGHAMPGHACNAILSF